MIVLALDSSAELISVALLNGDELLAEHTRRARRPASEGVLPVAEAVLAEAGVPLGDVSLLAVATGPGSFNGIRGGIATAEGLALGLGVPVVGIPTLDAAAYQHIGRAPLILALLPAGRDEHYGATYNGDWEQWRRLSEYTVGPLSHFLEGRPAGTLLSRRLSDEENSAVIAAGLRVAPFAEVPRAVTIALLGMRRYSATDFDAAASLRPLYLRHPGITRPTRPLSRAAGAMPVAPQAATERQAPE